MTVRVFRVPPLLLAVPLLGIARLLPAGDGFGLWVRLAAATLVVLLPGRLLSRALGLRGAAPALAWSGALVGAALALTVAVRGSLDLTLALVLAFGAAALPFSFRPRARNREAVPRGRGLATFAGLALGGALWFVADVVHGDALFHLGRIRKLMDLGSLSLKAVDEFRDGGLHPGYAFPLWHAWLGLVARLAGVDPTAVIRHEPSMLAPLALVLAFEMGVAVFRSVWLGAATMLGQVALLAFAPGHGGAYTTLELPGTTARQLLVPATTALFFLVVRKPSSPLWLTLAASGTVLAFVHPTYALFLAIPLAGFVLARALLAGEDVRRGLAALAAFGVPVGLVFAWLAPIVSGTRAHSPGPVERAAQLRHYAGDLSIHSRTSYMLAPEVVARAGAVAVAALVLVPLAGLAARRRWSALVLGGTLVVLVLELWSFVFPHFGDAVSLSQARRAAGFVPFAFAFAGGISVLARVSRFLVLPAALGAGIAFQLAFPGDYGVRSVHNGPAAATWIALYGSLAALVVGAVLARRRSAHAGRFERPGPTAALAALLFVLPVVVHGFSTWTPEVSHDHLALSPGLVRFLRTEVPKRSIVFGDLGVSYRISAYVPVYVTAEPPSHVADTRANKVQARRRSVLKFFGHGADLSIPRQWGAEWIVLRRTEPVQAVEQQGLTPVYRDGKFVVFKLPAD